MAWIFSGIFLCFLVNIYRTEAAVNYYGKYIGPLKSYHHGLAGEVYVVDSRTLHIRNFAYDGEGPAGYFYISNSKSPNENNGIKIRDEKGTLNPLKRYRKQHVTLTLPEGKTMANIKWFYVWCDEFAVNFGDVKIPKNLDFPKPQKIGKLHGVHGVSSENIVVVDAQTLLIPSFSYDGEAPDAKFWVGSGTKPTPQGIRVPDENGKETPLRKYDRKTIVLTLPADLTVFDIGHFGVWCEAFTVDFGHIQIPKEINIPPSLKMLGVSPQSKLNCEILHDDLAFEVRWAVAGDSIVIQLVSKLEKGEYMSFGVSGKVDRNAMIGGDVVVAWVDQDTLNGYAYDYILDAKSQCAGDRGSCPDTKIQPKTESVRLLNAALVNGYSIVTYQRPLRAQDSLDLPIYTNGSQAIIWAIGPLNSLNEVSYHSITSTATTLIDFGRTPHWNCPIPESDATVATSENEESYTEEKIHSPQHNVQQPRPHPESSNKPSTRNQAEIKKSNPSRTIPTPAPAPRDDVWEIPAIQCHEPEDGVFYAQMGPTGGKRGYSAITGHVGWGISWYINGLLIPEINVVRGRTYTFVVEGGLDPEIPAKYHPFYITDDPVGGFLYKTPDEKSKAQIFAGVIQNKAGELVPTGIGRLCNWTPDPEQPPADEFLSFGAYQRTLSLVCDHGEPGVIQWTPDENTPDTVYYQCYSHRYLGWKINVLDNCDKEPASSEQIITKVKVQNPEASETDPLQTDNSYHIATRIKPIANNKNESSQIYNLVKQENQLLQNDDYSQIHHHDHQSDNLKQDFMMNVEKEVLQDPYMPPKPYQKNFDYQSMQNSKFEEPKISKITSTTTTTTTPTSTPPAALYNIYQENITQSPLYNSKPQILLKPQIVQRPYSHPSTQMQHVPYIPLSSQNNMHTNFRNNIAANTNNGPKISAYPPHPNYQKNRYPEQMHIHIIKHDESEEEPYPIIRPHIHSMVIKKPLQRIVNPKRPLPTDSQISASVPVHSVLIPPMRTSMQHGMLVSYDLPPPNPVQLSQKVYNNLQGQRKREDIIKVQSNNEPVLPTSQHIGFNPNSIVIEGGFKPIVHGSDSKNAQDRMSIDEKDYIEEDVLEDTTATIYNNSMTNNSSDISKNPFEGKQPELFEPIFIPSPPVNELQKKSNGNSHPSVVDRTNFNIYKPSQSSVYFIRHKPKLTTKPVVYSDYLSNTVVEGDIINGIAPPKTSAQGFSSPSQSQIHRIDQEDKLLIDFEDKSIKTTTKTMIGELNSNSLQNHTDVSNATERKKIIDDETTHASNHRYPEDRKYRIRKIFTDRKVKRENVESTKNNAFLIMVPDTNKS